MKHIFLFLTLSIALLSCKKECPHETMPVCSEVPPTNEVCQAYFERWFFDKESNECSKISYSGCSQKGFETLEDCEECACKD